MHRHTLLTLAFIAIAGPSTANAACSTAGLDLPPHFCATVFASDARQPRHIAVAANGVVYANLNRGEHGHNLVALVDTDGDGKADKRDLFGKGGATGLTIHDGWLYAASTTTVRRYRLGNRPVPGGPVQTIVTDMPKQDAHTARGLALDDQGHLYVSIGAPSNACQEKDREPGSPGQKPCPLLARHGGVWRFAADKPNQKFSPDARFATGIRNMFALAYDERDRQLIGVQMGRDQLKSLWPSLFSIDQNVKLPAEIMLAVHKGDKFGWPYCYYDGPNNTYRLSPEYGGNGTKVGHCQRFKKPIAAYPAHWAPMAIVFYRASDFPKRYRNGAFIAFHGSWNRAPAPQAGFRVIYQPFKHGKPDGHFQTFAGPKGFTGEKVVRSPGSAAHRPAGLAVGPKGALYISDDQGSTIYRVTYNK